MKQHARMYPHQRSLRWVNVCVRCRSGLCGRMKQHKFKSMFRLTRSVGMITGRQVQQSTRETISTRWTDSLLLQSIEKNGKLPPALFASHSATCLKRQAARMSSFKTAYVHLLITCVVMLIMIEHISSSLQEKTSHPRERSEPPKTSQASPWVQPPVSL